MEVAKRKVDGIMANAAGQLDGLRDVLAVVNDRLKVWGGTKAMLTDGNLQAFHGTDAKAEIAQVKKIDGLITPELKTQLTALWNELKPE